MARSIEMVVSGEIAAPPSAVWPYLVGWEGLTRWMKEASEVKVTSAAREGVGVEAEATIRIGGIRTVDPILVTRWEPPHLLEVAHRGWVKGSGTMTAAEGGSGTLMVWTETLIPPWGAVGAWGMAVWIPLMRRRFRRDFNLLKALVESEQGRPAAT